MNEMWCATRYAVCVWPIGLQMKVTQSTRLGTISTRTQPEFTARCVQRIGKRQCTSVDYVWNVMAHAQKPDFVLRRNGRVHLNRLGPHFSRLLAAEVCASAVVMLDAPCSEVVWRILATQSIRQFPLHFPAHASAVCHHISTGLYRTHKQPDLNMFRELERPGGNLSTSPVRCSNSLSEMHSLTSAACRQSNMKPRIRLWQVVCRWYIPEGLVLQRQTCSVRTRGLTL